jgi:hypothetical protein
MLETSGRWVAYVRLEDPPGLSPITTVGRYDSVEAAQVATDEVWAARFAPVRSLPAGLCAAGWGSRRVRRSPGVSPRGTVRVSR